jgi:hypothetical protein
MIPTKWCVKITEDNREVLELYRLTSISSIDSITNCTCLIFEALNKYLISDNAYSDNMYWGANTPSEIGYEEISFEDFKVHILNELPKNPKKSKPEDLSYLIDFLKQQQIT